MQIEIRRDNTCDMIRVDRDGKTVFEGNTWDLPSDATSLSVFLTKLGLDVWNSTYRYQE